MDRPFATLDELEAPLGGRRLGSQPSQEPVGRDRHPAYVRGADHEDHVPARPQDACALFEYLGHLSEVAVHDPGSLRLVRQPLDHLVDLGNAEWRRRRVAWDGFGKRSALAAEIVAAKQAVVLDRDVQHVGHPGHGEQMGTRVVQG